AASSIAFGFSLSVSGSQRKPIVTLCPLGTRLGFEKTPISLLLYEMQEKF
ncbi:unnamed protein product, partial [marine sediment metagenome]